MPTKSKNRYNFEEIQPKSTVTYFRASYSCFGQPDKVIKVIKLTEHIPINNRREKKK